MSNIRQVVRAPVWAFRTAIMEPEKPEEEEELFQNLKETRQKARKHAQTTSLNKKIPKSIFD
ncbi:hypothetical protein [Algoriphagus namhaensis]